jgi:flagellar protein FlaG
MSIEIPLNIIAGNSRDTTSTDRIVLPAHAPVVRTREDGKSAWDMSELRKMLDSLEKEINLVNRRLKFDVNKEINRIVIKVIDSKTDEVIREIPEKEIQKLIAQINKMIGILYDKQI